MNTTPYWLKTAGETSFPALKADLKVDVLVVGGGITGLTAAWLLLRAGKSVAVVERNRIATGDTGHTTAHLTQVIDSRLTELVSKFGRDHARAIWDASVAAISQIRSIAQEIGIICELRSAPGFLVAALDGDAEKEAKRLREEAKLAVELGFDATFLEADPITQRPCVRYANQWKFHPVKYLHGLVEAFVQAGGQIFEETELSEFLDTPGKAKANGRTISYTHSVLATHVPLQGNVNTVSAMLFQTKLAGYSTYAIEARVPVGSVPEILWWDTSDPYLYLRVDHQEDAEIVIFGGEDHKTGQETDTAPHFAALEDKLRKMLPVEAIESRWSGQVIEPVDGIPYIGEMSEGQFMATGFAGNGTTFGTLAAMMACDWVTGGTNPWTDLFAVERKKLSSTWDYLVENKDYPFYLAKGFLSRGEKDGLNALKPGEGAIVRHEGHKVAAFCDHGGKTHLMSPICPHLGCVVGWNQTEQTWDCPCHGSRFKADGEVFAGPAETDLAPAAK